MQTKRILRKGIDRYRQLPLMDRLWVAKELAKELDPLPVSEIKRLARAFGFGVRQPKVFLCHSHHDKRFVRTLARKLEEHGIGVWLDEAELNVGDSLLSHLSKAIYAVDFVLAVISKASNKSNWVKEELEMAMTQHVAGKKLTVLPLLKDKCRLPKFLGGKFYADFTNSYRRRINFIILINSILKHYVSLPTIENTDATGLKIFFDEKEAQMF